ncbi:peptidoglycan/LPS O-acetylase OafA/YrhL [Ancylobacter aquaticus]|uniref:Peptidoglycan/LPS O-acetylase OafA/YrhL n=1 Tax=Ancylobacter aquaticus TaxID=100 RepID=A0A4R1IAS6_ANCAQ|nr:acyltransferase family protein [Ancylobacter aquaticus]TCK31471.1 peptidoglycan/LPS O-acetylase OafA/YrhL [Ancylobacter aquaticus]
MHHSLRYRAHIDGLRAVAVLGVVLYHFGATWLPGGFVGVDVFFVISGFLISKSIYGDVEAGRFSLLGFYERRIRRIAPAFLVVTAVTAAFATLILLPYEMMIFGRSVLWSVFAAGNIFFFQRTDYFGPAAQEMPLLHYWSLGVEEQFYFLFPALVLIAARFGRRAIVWSVPALLLASLAASQFMVTRDPAAAYFLLPFRAFEMLIGSALALPGMRFAERRAVRVAAVAGGCALILGGMVGLSSASPFPGLLALIPCLGTALVIWGGEGETTLPTRLLGSRPMVFFGAISYSLYLVHWPLAALGREWLGPVAPLPFLVGGVVLSTLLGFLSWRFVEQPVRVNRRAFTPKVLLGTTMAGTLALAAFAQTAISTRGLPTRLDPEVQRLAAYSFYNGDPVFRQGFCFTPFFQAAFVIKPECLPTRHPSMLVWGSSHIAHFITAFIEAGEARGYAVGQITGAACPPVLEPANSRLPYCTAMNAFARDWVQANKPDILVLGGLGAPTPALDEALEGFARQGIRVVVVGPVPHYRDSVPKLLARRLMAGDSDTGAGADLLPSARRQDERLRAHFAGNPHVTYISVFDAACGGTDCPLIAKGVPLQHDSSHFTQAGAHFFGRPVSALIFGDPAK